MEQGLGRPITVKETLDLRRGCLKTSASEHIRFRGHLSRVTAEKRLHDKCEYCAHVAYDISESTIRMDIDYHDITI